MVAAAPRHAPGLAALWAIGALLAVPLPATAQPGVFSLLFAGGRDTEIGGAFVAAAEFRWEARSAGFTPLAMGGVHLTENSCADSLPPQCSYPAGVALQLRGGIAGAFDLDFADFVVVPSVGMLRWGGAWDPAFRLDAALRVGITPGVQLETGVRQDWIWMSARDRDVFTGERRLDSVGLVLGLRFDPTR
jgi:hypothetical protein